MTMGALEWGAQEGLRAVAPPAPVLVRPCTQAFIFKVAKNRRGSERKNVLETLLVLSDYQVAST